MVLKGLPSEYRIFATVITQKDSEVGEFKIILKSFEETDKCHQTETGDDIMINKYHKSKSVLKCYNCQKVGHKKSEYRIKSNSNLINNG